MKLRAADTIVAIATPPGTGAVSVVRVSGPESIAIVDGAFRGIHTLSQTPGYTIRHGHFLSSKEEVIDEVLVAIFRSPHSYTGEDSVEISCHGGGFVTRMVLSSLVERGARQADPGEFTKRAFVNGKMDLAQAEAVADLISASSESALRNSNAQLKGALGIRVGEIKDRLMKICSLLELDLDFSEDDIPITTRESTERELSVCIQEIDAMIATYRLGKIAKDGVSVAIVGRPNVGKSSVFNSLLMSSRSIVSHFPGTTRDFLEESLLVDGTLVRLFDTAGLRGSSDEVESAGIARTMSIIEDSDVVLLIVDSEEEWSIKNILHDLPAGAERNLLIVKNKIDLDSALGDSGLIHLGISATTREGVEDLRRLVLRVIHADQSEGCGHSVSAIRHVDALRRSKEFVVHSMESVRSGLTGEFVLMDLRSAIDLLSEITGDVTTEDILNRIFSNFCIGK